MSDYIAPGGGYYGSQRPLKSVYYPPQQRPSQPQLNQQQQIPQSSSQIPPGTVPVINLIETPPGVKLVSFQQDVAASIPPQLQQQMQQLKLQQQSQQALQQQNNNNNVPVYVGSDYAAAGWGTTYHATPIRIVNQPSQQQSQQQLQQQGIAEAAIQLAQSEYEQAVAQAQRAAERLSQLSGAPQAQYSSFSQASGQGYGAAPGGQQLQQQQQFQQQQSPRPQGVRFGGVQRISTPSNSSYRFEESAPAARSFQQAQAESVYIGMPNNLYLASNRPRDYHYTPPQRQQSNSNLQQLATARENQSQTNLRARQSEENIRTAVLNEDGNVIGIVQTNYKPAQQQQQQGSASLGAGSSDYHFDALRGLNSALDNRA